MKKQKEEVAKRKPTSSERFAHAVMREYQGSVGSVVANEEHRKEMQSYFIALDNTFKIAEEKRLSTPEHKRDSLAFSWENVNLQKLALDVVAYTKMGLNPLLPNHINLIPYKNKKTNKFDIGFLEGYAGKELIARRYALDAPDFAVVELVYSNDEFQAIKKGVNNAYDSYEFAIPDPFNRGKIMGGFYYHVFEEKPILNKLVVVSYADILKRKPKYASAEFWGGEKTICKNNKPAGTETIEGWHDKMCEKTVKRMCWNDVVIDGNKIDDSYTRAKESSMENVDLKIENEIMDMSVTEELVMPSTKPDVEPKKEEPAPTAKAKPIPVPDAAKPDPAIKEQSFSDFKKEKTEVDKDGQSRAF